MKTNCLMGMILSSRTMLLAFLGLAVAHLDILVPSVSAADPVLLVNHTNNWIYRKGTNEPPADWKTVASDSLDDSWQVGPGGFGYDDGDDATQLLDMFSNYVTVYTRQSFDIASAVDTNLHLQVLADWDDAFIAYLNGVEIARSSNLPVIPPDGFHPFDQDLDSLPGAGPHREAGTVQTFDLGPVMDRLPVGTHTLAVLGINSDLFSSDMSLIVDLVLDAPVADIVWGPEMGPIEVTSDLFIPGSSSLTVQPGTQIMMGPDVSIITDGGAINFLGTKEAPIIVSSMVPGVEWDRIEATGSSATLTMQHADVSGGRIRMLDGTTGLIEDTHVYDNTINTPIVFSADATSVVMRRCHVERYFETLFQRTPMTIEDSLFETPRGDAVDFDGPPAGSVIRRCTFNSGPGNNTDAVDIGPSRPVSVPVSVLIEDCLMFGFGDKGVSIGEIGQDFSESIVVRNCLIYEVGKGVQVKDTTITTIYNCTIIDSDIGIHGFFKQAANPGGGIITNYNNILFDNLESIVTNSPPNSTFITTDYSNVSGFDWAGTGNINADPLFVDAGARDYRLQDGSPCIGTGLGGVNMGITYPIGGAPARPDNLAVNTLTPTSVELTWDDLSVSEDGFLMEISTNLVDWAGGSAAAVDATSLVVSNLLDGQPYFFRMRATNFLGRSLISNVSSLGGTLDDLDGDQMPNDWETANGLDPNNALDAILDSDDDGADNLNEFKAGTDPQDPNSRLAFQDIQLGEFNTVVLTFEVLSNRSYRVLFKNSLEDESWLLLEQVAEGGETRIFSVTDNLLPIFKSRFYRLEIP